MFDIGTLDQFADITMGQSPKGTSVSNKGEIPLLNGPTEFGINHPTPVQFTNDPKRFAKKGDLLFCVRGSTTGRMNWSDRDYAIGRGLASIRAKNQYSRYFIRGSIELFLKELLQSATGSTFPNINKDQLHKMECYLPDERNLKKIDEVLRNISQKIELNQKINVTLEEIAKTLFKSWFINFDPVRAKAEGRPSELSKEISDLFPDSFEDCELGEIPKGWNYRSIYEDLNVIYGAPFSSKMFNSVSKGTPVIRIRDLKKQQSDIYTEEVHPKGVLIEKGDVVVGMDGEFRPYLWSGENAWMNQRICKFAPKHDSSSTFIIENLRKQLRFIELTEVATTVIHLGKSDIDEFLILNEDRGAIEAFNKICKPIEEKIISNNFECRKLEEIRDTLLPKLISGELKISDAENLVEEAGI